ncbi:MAG: ATP-binding protein [Kangiellaceae bacterium]|jgi:hypothetical protein|nr:ATP-binding protein [Kangiellaceae bacterium]
MSLLKTVTQGKKIKPLALLLHGVHGIGKSTFGSQATKPIFIGSEENDELDTSRFPKVERWSDLIAQLKTLKDEDHDYKTVVIDTVDSLEQVAQKDIVKANETMATAMGGFGKAYEKQRDMFLDIRDNYLIPLRDQKGMNIVLLAHSEKVKHEDPITNTQYDHYQTAIHKKVKPVFEDWVSAILFANFELYKSKRDSDGKEYAIGEGERRVFTEERPSHIAKNRFELDYEMPLNFSDIAKMIAKHYKGAEKAEVKVYHQDGKKVTVESSVQNDGVNELKYQIEQLMVDLPDSMLDKIGLAYKRAGDKEDELMKLKKRIEKALS